MNEMHDELPIDRDQHSTSPLEFMRQILTPIASLRITVVLLLLGIVLVFFGTLAQIDEGIWTVMDKYFQSWFVWIPFQLVAKFLIKFFAIPESTYWAGSFPFPGGWAIGWAMLVNLLAAHAIRFRLTWKRSGVLLIHAGMIMLMLGEFLRGRLAVEATMVLQKNEQASFIDDSRNFELVIRTRTDDASEQVFVIPRSILMNKVHEVISDLRLPVDIEVLDCLKNSDLVRLETGLGDESLISSDGGYYKVVPAGEEPGVKAEREDAAAVSVKVRPKGKDEVLGSYFLSLWQYRNYNRRLFFVKPRTFALDGKTYTIELRNKRIEQPFSLQLLKFEHKVYEGTQIAKDFASTVRLLDKPNIEDREVRIWMNNPLRHEGETFYQAGYIPDESGTVLQVVNNPVWQWPYYSCAIVALGMMVHFGTNLRTFLRRRANA